MLTKHCCPRCNEPLSQSHDMWGEFHLCEECGFTEEEMENEEPEISASCLLTLSPPYEKEQAYRKEVV